MEGGLVDCANMAWLTRLDARSQHWPRLIRWAYLGLKYYLLAAGVFLWVMLWWQRHWLLGVMQVLFVGYVLASELRGHRGGDLPDD